MKRMTATILTIIMFLFYGIPSFVFCFYGAQMLIGSTNADYRAGFEYGSNGMSPDIILPLGLSLICVFAYLLFVPILVGFISFRASKKNEPIVETTGDRPSV